MAAKGQSKNSRVSRAAKPSGFEPSAAVSRIIATGAGDHAYLLVTTGKTVHAKVGTDKFMAALADLAAYPGMPERVTAEIEALEAQFPEAGWAAAWASTLDTATAA